MHTVHAIETSTDNQNLLSLPKVKKFIQTMQTQHQFSEKMLTTLFSHTKIKQNIIKAMQRPAEKKPWYSYRPIFLTKKRIQKGRAFYKKYKTTLQYAEKIYGVSGYIITAIIGVETFYGKHQGSYRVIDALSTLAFAYPPRSSFFRQQLVEFLLMCKEENLNPLELKGSYAGAMGMGQFIPGSFRNFAIDFDGDGKKDIWHNPVDAIGSVAYYFQQHGWEKNLSIAYPATVIKKGASIPKEMSLLPRYSIDELKKIGFQDKANLPGDTLATIIPLEQKKTIEYWLAYQNFYAITRYNHSAHYAMAVFQLSQAIEHL